MTYTHYTKISRSDHGIIERRGERIELGKRGIPGIVGATTESRVVTVENGTVAGWGTARAIGTVQHLIDGRAEGEPFLALLH